MTPEAPPHVRDIGVVLVVIPLEWPIRTASGTVTDASLSLPLPDLQTEEGTIGRSYLRRLSPSFVLTMGDMVE